MLEDDAGVQHVLMTADAAGGVWTYALELAHQLSRFGIRTTLATMGEALHPPQREAVAHIPGLRVFESTFKLEWMEDPWRDVAMAGDWLLALAERERPDVVHLNGYAHAALDWRAPCLVVGHSCLLSWWKAVLGEPAPAKYARYQREVIRGLRAADAVVAPTRAMLRALREHYGAPHRGTVISNGADPTQFSVARKESFVLAAGRIWDQAKNLGALASVAPHLGWPVVLAGSDKHPDGHERRQDGIRALGWLEPAELRRWMARAGIYAFPARYEPFGLSVLEAALSGCALVLGDVESLREVWGDAALYVPSEDWEALLDAIERLVHDDLLRMRMSSAARGRALGFTADRMARRYVDLYRELVSRRSAGSAPRPVVPRSSDDEGGSTVQPSA
jgi:glycosyltransferase involved in cell wall biosynthesis